MSIGDSPQLSEGGSVSVDVVDDSVLFRLYFGGKFVQLPGSQYKYEGGETFMESVGRSCTYSELMHKLNEKFDCDLSIKYLAPGEELDPGTLVSVLDDNDLKELYREFFAGRANPRNQSTFRIRLFLFEAVEDEDMTPDDFEDDTCYGMPFEELPGRAGALLLEGRSSYGSNLSSSSNPAHSLDAEASGGYHPQMLHYTRATAWSVPYHTHVRMGPIVSPPVPHAALDPEAATWTSQELLKRIAMSYSKQGPDIFMQSAPMIMDPIPLEAIRETIAKLSQDAEQEGAGVLKQLTQQEQQPQEQQQLELTQQEQQQQQQQLQRTQHEQQQLRQLRLTQQEQQQQQLTQQSVQRSAQQLQHQQLLQRLAHQQLLQQQQQQQPASAFSPTIHLPSWDDGNNQRWLGTSTGTAIEDTVPSRSPNLPSHISAFGETAAERLPSHISAFGESSRGDLGDLQPYVDGLDLEMDFLSQDVAEEDCCEGGPHTQELGSFDLDGARMSTQPPTPEQLGGASPPARPPMQPLPLHGLSGVAEGAGEEAEGAPEEAAALAAMDSVHYVLSDDVTRVSSIGDGAFGEVFKAEIDMFGTVAVKWLKAGKLQKHSENFKKEAAMLARLNHPNVLRFYGIVTDSHSSAKVLGIITEYMRGGSLASYLRQRARTGYLSLRERCNLALHAARGMSYLHEVKVVHFDLKPDNLLIDGDGPNNMVVKVADFGLSKHKFTAYVSTCRDLRGTLPYMAPELVAEPSRVSEKADLWSMGVVMWEMLTLEVPYRDLAPQQILMGLMTGSVHLSVPEWCEPEWRGLLEACLDISPARRPSFKELAAQLERIRNAA